MPHRTILIAEDNAVDIMMVRRAFARAGIQNPVQLVSDGTEAVAYLSGQGKFADRSKFPLPHLVLLDLKMPLKNGFEVLEWMREQTAFDSLRVVVLAGSQQTSDIDHAFGLGACSYLVKPPGFDELCHLVKTVHEYWLGANVAGNVTAI